MYRCLSPLVPAKTFHNNLEKYATTLAFYSWPNGEWGTVLSLHICGPRAPKLLPRGDVTRQDARTLYLPTLGHFHTSRLSIKLLSLSLSLSLTVVQVDFKVT
jgi:hypothetical protein